MDQVRSRGLVRLALPLLATVGAMASFQIGAALAKVLFPVVGPQGAATLRLCLGAGMLIAVARPWRAWPRDAALVPLFGLGLAMAAVIVMFFLALERLPLGVVIALQFLGPLAIALVGSRRRTDLIWAALAGGGVWCLVGTVPATTGLDLVGVGSALGAAVGWASYILLGRAAGASFGSSTAALAVTIGALLVLPFGAKDAGAALLSPALIATALLMALFASAIPFSLEMYALPRVPARTFAVFTSLEPAFGVLSGLVILNERLSSEQISGVALVVAAAAGAAWGMGGGKVEEETPNASGGRQR